MCNKYHSKEVQNIPKLLEYYLLKLGEVKFQIGELDKYINHSGCTIVSLALKFQEFDEFLTNTEDKLIEIRKMCLGDGTFKMKEVGQ